MTPSTEAAEAAQKRAVPKVRAKQNIGYWRKYGVFYIMMAPGLLVFADEQLPPDDRLFNCLQAN